MDENRWLYAGREQSYVKHKVLERYLEQFAIKVGSFSPGVTYVDGFSGPWGSRDDQSFQDTSFALAIGALRKARDAVASTFKRKLALRCLFVEENAVAFKKLSAFADTISDAELKTVRGRFEDNVSNILDFVRGGGAAFPFYFIDPTGWTGFPIAVMKPLLQHRPSEVLINFMTSHIRRFIISPEEQQREEFEALFGSAAFRDELIALVDLRDREDAMLRLYMKAVRTAGDFGFASASTVLHPMKEDTHFHLVFCTRHAMGLQVFKDADKKAMQTMQDRDAAAARLGERFEGLDRRMES